MTQPSTGYTPYVYPGSAGKPVTLGPFIGGLHNSSGTGEAIDDKELFSLVNLEVDLDGSLANRPAIGALGLSGITGNNIRVIGYYAPSVGGKFIVCCTSTNILVYDTSGTLVFSQAFVGICCVQYKDAVYFPATPIAAGGGGYITYTGTWAWTAVAGMPPGEAIVLYKERLWVASGITSTGVGASRLYFSAIGNGASWTTATDFADVSPGNGQKLVSMTVLNNDIILFKEHSTFRFGYSSIVTKFDLSNISVTIGVPSPSCAVTYDSNNVYVLHDNNVYELFNYSYTKISKPVAIRQLIDNSLYATEIYGLSLYRDRLFVRYYGYMYVYSLVTKTWSQWTTSRKFSRIVTIPSADIGLDTAYATSASSSDPNQVYYFRDDRITGVGTVEAFTCSITTKTYDLDIPHVFKVLYWWGLNIATSGDTTAAAVVPNAGQNYTWNYMLANYTWAGANTAGIKWSNNDMVVVSQTVASTLGKFAKKFLKLAKKLRFRQIYFTVSAVAVSNSISDASVRIYDLTAIVKSKETVVKGTS